MSRSPKSLKEMAIDSVERMRRSTIREHEFMGDMKESDPLILKDNESLRSIDTEGNDDYLQYLIPTLFIGVILQQLFIKKSNNTVLIISSDSRQEGMKTTDERLAAKEVFLLYFMFTIKLLHKCFHFCVFVSYALLDEFMCFT
jgi:hypothetical protein